MCPGGSRPAPPASHDEVTREPAHPSGAPSREEGVVDSSVMHFPAPRAIAATRHGMSLLGAGVPLTLLLDLAGVPGSSAAEILADEAR